MPSPCPARLGAAFATLSRAAGLPGEQMDPYRMIMAARTAVPHADHVAFAIADTHMRPREFSTTDPVAVQVDVIQRELREGPALEPITGPDVVRVDDLRRDERWPRFATVATRVTGVRSLLAVRTPLVGHRYAALCFYADRTTRFDAEDATAGRLIAALASNCLDREAARAKANNLEVALASATTIGTAIGILVARESIDRNEAFERLRFASQNLHRKLHDIAEEVCETGVLPEPARLHEHRVTVGHRREASISA